MLQIDWGHFCCALVTPSVSRSKPPTATVGGYEVGAVASTSTFKREVPHTDDVTNVMLTRNTSFWLRQRWLSDGTEVFPYGS